MSRIGRMLPLGAVLLAVSCADGTGPPNQPSQQPLGSVIGPGVSTAELHPLAHRMSIGSPGDLPLLQEVAQSSADVPLLETYELNFWAKRGESRGAEVHYIGDGSGDASRFLSFQVPPYALRSRPDGTPFASGDSVLISISIDREALVVEFGPPGLVFNLFQPAELEVWYSGAEVDVPQEQLGIWHQQEAGQLWYRIVSEHDTGVQLLNTHVFHFSTFAVSW